MITTDYKNLLTDETRPRFLHAMEGLTGNNLVYGDTTPIKVADVLDHIGLSTAIQCFNAAVQNISSVRKTLGLEFIRPYIPFFNELTGNVDSRLNDLLSLGELYLSIQGEGSTPTRLDYCGDPIDAVGAITPAQIAGKQKSLSDTYGTLAESHGSSPFYVVCLSGVTNAEYSNSGDNYRPAGLLDTSGVNGGPVKTTIDPAQVPLPFTKRGYLENPILQEIKNGNIIKESADFYQRGLAGGKGVVWTLADVGALSGNGPQAGTIIPWYTNIAIKYFAQAMILAINQVLYDTSNLDTISELVTQAVANYAAAKAEPLPTVIYNLRCMSSNQYGGTPLLVVPGAEEVTQRIISAGDKIKFSLLTDRAYLTTFDLDFSQGLNAQERYNLEIAVQERTLQARAEQTQIEFQSAQDRYFFYKTLTADLGSIFRLYIV